MSEDSEAKPDLDNCSKLCSSVKPSRERELGDPGWAKLYVLVLVMVPAQ